MSHHHHHGGHPAGAIIQLIILLIKKPILGLVVLVIIWLLYLASQSQTPSAIYQVTWNRSYDPATYGSLYAAQGDHLVVINVTVANKTNTIRTFTRGDFTFYSSGDGKYWDLAQVGPASVTLEAYSYQTFDLVVIVPNDTCGANFTVSGLGSSGYWRDAIC
jgi:hypothetical protein